MRKILVVTCLTASLVPSTAFLPFVPPQVALPEPVDKETTAVEDKLMEIGHKLKLEVFDIDDGIYGLDSKDYHYGIEVIKTPVRTTPSLGLELTELASGSDGQGLVLVSGVYGNAAKAEPKIEVGDTITGVLAGRAFKERTVGLDYDLTVEAIDKAKRATTDGKITLQINRLVPKAKIVVEIDDGEQVHTVETLAGENLRSLLMRKHIKLYDPKTKRFDQPFSTGDCAGEGICGTCLVAVEEGQELLSPPSDLEKFITKERPLKWRAACRTIIGANNQEGTLRIRLHPQSGMDDELTPHVKDVSMRP